MKVFGVETLTADELGEQDGNWIFAVTENPGEIAKIPGFRSAAFQGEIVSSDVGVTSLFKVTQQRPDTTGQAMSLASTLTETFHLAVDAERLFGLDDIIYVEKLEPVVFL